MNYQIKDTLLKNIIMAYPQSFVRFFLKGVEDILDLSRPIEFLNGELQQAGPDTADPANRKSPTRLDMLLKLPLRRSLLDYLLLLVEIHGYNKPDYPAHVHRNFSRLRDKYNDRVAVLVIYTETAPHFRPSRFDYTLLGTRLSFSFSPYVVWDQQETALENDDNEMALMFLAVLLFRKVSRGKKHDEQLLEAKIRLLKNLQKRKLDPEGEANFLTLISLYKDFYDMRFNHTFEEAVRQLNFKKETMTNLELYAMVKAKEARKEGRKEGIEQGIEKGIEQGRTAVVRNMLQRKRFAMREIAAIAEVPIDFVKSVKMQLSLS